jgi:hypothetical protein
LHEKTGSRAKRLPVENFVKIGSAATAATATAAAGRGNIIVGRDAAEFDGRTDVFGDVRLERFKFALGFEEIASDLVLEKSVACGFEIVDLGLAQLDARALLVTQILALFMDALILETGGVIGKEPLDLGLMGAECRIRNDFGAELFGFRNDGGFFGNN